MSFGHVLSFTFATILVVASGCAVPSVTYWNRVRTNRTKFPGQVGKYWLKAGRNVPLEVVFIQLLATRPQKIYATTSAPRPTWAAGALGVVDNISHLRE